MVMCQSSVLTNTFGRENILIASSTSVSFVSSCSLADLTLSVSLLMGSEDNFDVRSLWPDKKKLFLLYIHSVEGKSEK